jgi:hypothetical protein
MVVYYSLLLPCDHSTQNLIDHQSQNYNSQETSRYKKKAR